MKFISVFLVMFIFLVSTANAVASGEIIDITGRFIGKNNYLLVSVKNNVYNVKGKVPEGLKENDYLEVKGTERKDEDGNSYIWALRIRVLLPVTISSLKEGVKDYLNKKVLIYGEFRGWEGTAGPPPVTRSDWLIKDDTGYIYVLGAPPFKPGEDKGKKIALVGVLKVSRENIPYIEPLLVDAR